MNNNEVDKLFYRKMYLEMLYNFICLPPMPLDFPLVSRGAFLGGIYE